MSPVVRVVAFALLPFAASAADSPYSVKISSDRRISHALSRLTFGAKRGDLEAIRRVGLNQWIELQLHPERIEADAILAEKLKPFKSLTMTPERILAWIQDTYRLGSRSQDIYRLLGPQLFRDFAQAPEEVRRAVLGLGDSTVVLSPEMRRARILLRDPRVAVNRDPSYGKLLRAIYSNRQLEEVLTDFWFNHFNVYGEHNGNHWSLTASYEREAIRPYVLGKFGDMLGAVARHPAMLYYLDNYQSVRPGFDPAEVRGAYRDLPVEYSSLWRGLNENYGRELLELHTLGSGGGYSQDDVTAAARCFTGWMIQDPVHNPSYLFVRDFHDPNAKKVLGRPFRAGGGVEDGERLLELLARHPSTARHISRKLAQRFVADDPPTALVERMAKRFLETDGDLRDVMRTMIDSPEFFSEGAWRAKTRSPFEFVVAAARAVDADVYDPDKLDFYARRMGQPLYGKREPNGYPEVGAGWNNSADFTWRLDYAAALSAGKLDGVKVPENSRPPARMVRDLLGAEPSKSVTAALGGAYKGKGGENIAAVVLGSPDFQRR